MTGFGGGDGLIFFGSASSGEGGVVANARAATRDALARLGSGAPKLAIAFSSGAAIDVDTAADAVRAELGAVPIVGGTAAGAVTGPEGVHKAGVGVVLVGGDVEVETRSVQLESESQLRVVPLAAQLGSAADDAAARGLTEFTCLVFAPASGPFGDSDLLISAVRKGVGHRAKLAGAMVGDPLTLGSARVLDGLGARPDTLVLAGIFSARPFGVAARHGWRATGRVRRVTRSDGTWLVSLDNAPAFDIWATDARTAGGLVPAGRTQEAVVYLAAHFGLDVRAGDAEEPIVRIPLAVRTDGAVRLSGSVGETTRTRIVRATRPALLEAASHAAKAAKADAGGSLSGAVVLTSSSRRVALGAEFPRESQLVARDLAAKVGGACVMGEIAGGGRQAEAFHNASVLVIAVPSGR